MIGDMARITLSPFITDIRGSVKGKLIFSKNQHGHMVHTRKESNKPPTEAQLVTRQAYSDALDGWRALPNATKLEYHVMAGGLGLPHGMNLYLREVLGGGTGGTVPTETTLTAAINPDGNQESIRLPPEGDGGYYNFRYTFEVLADGNVVIEVSGTADPIIWLDDASGNEIASDDDSGDNLGSRIDMALTVGTYTLEVGVYWDRDVDSTSLTLAITGLVGNLVDITVV
jgi:hypothetical protein